jgi:hypothetical protein
MKQITASLILIFMALATGLCAEQSLSPMYGKDTDAARGMTTAELETPGATILTAPAYIGELPPLQQKTWKMRPEPRTEEQFEAILPARSQYGLQFDDLSNSIGLYSSLGSFSENLTAALELCPLWLRAELQNTLLQLTDAKRELYASLILNTTEPLIDEVAFAIAHSSPQYLNSDLARPELFTENAAFIYSIDQNLPYVQVVDYGNHNSDPNYYSTTRYKRLNSEGTLEEIEVPFEIYYWYIVHPKLTDEIAAYIDPAIVESNSNHNNNITAPPTGVFWRSWLYSVQESDYPVLADTLNQCQTLFNRNGNPGDAIRTIQWWINQTMSFTSNAERPHQPVRIYRKHMGRCGEYQDYTAAVARLGLIPCTGILSVSTDHVWNEFWESDWVQWEPVNGYIDNPLVYENGWGKVFGSVFECRSDGYFSSVTERYSEGNCTIRIRVVDNQSRPVDGARVILAILETTPRVDMIGFTDNDGWVVFSVGENRDYRARCETSWGIYPAIAGTYAALTPTSVDGEIYDYLFTIDQIMPQPAFTQTEPPADQFEDYHMAITYSSPAYYISGRVTWDDISSLGVYPNFLYEVEIPGAAAAFTLDADNLLFLQYDNMASIFDDGEPQSSGTCSFTIPDNSGLWYTLLDGSHLSSNASLVSGTLEYLGAVANEDEGLVPTIGLNLACYPNPFRESTTIKFSLDQAQNADLAVYNLRGQLICNLQSGEARAGEQELSWDGTDLQGRRVAPGLYFLRLSTGGESLSQKLIVMD